MKLRFALLLVVVAASCSRDLTLPDPPPTTGFVSGRVVVAVPGTSQSAPLAGATVALLSSNLHATTDERGQFLLGPLPRGDYRLFFASKGNGVTRQRLLTGVPVRPGATNSVGDVSIQENALLTGRALIEGRSSGNVGITIFSPGTDYATTTADNGAWLLSNLPEGTIRASAWRPGFTPATTTDIQLQGGVITSAVDMILEPEAASAPPGSILGRVIVIGRDDSSGVTVKAISALSQELKVTTATDESGAFTLAGLGPDLYTITLELPGYPRARVPNLAVAGGVQLELIDPIIMAVEGEGNTPSSEPIGGPSGPFYTLDGGVTSPDGGVITGDDGGTVGAECTDDNQCASGRLCVSSRCVSCSVNVQCRPGFSCVAGDCVRDCQDNSQCAGGKVCIGGSCTSCITSSDCRDASLVCNAQAVCARCRDRSECPAGKACLPGGCGDCTQDSECGAGALCEQGVCTAGDCHTNADCSSNEACVGRSCGTCSADSQCRAGQLCIGDACVVGNCRSVLECSTGQVCLGNQCGACANDGDCGAGQLCLPGTNGLRCTAATCRVSGDCTGASAGQLCVNNQCTPCGTANPCSNGQICNAQGRCVTGNCFSNLDCTGAQAGFACLSGNCTPCGVASDCGASGYVCVSGQCRVGNCVAPSDCALQGQLCLSNACVGCSNTSQCPANQVCDSTDSLCHPGNCLATAECGATQVCTNRFCGACTQDSQCGPGKLCLGGACTIANCRLPSDCAVQGQLCVANTCTACTQTSQCGSGQVCDTGLCQAGNCVTSADCTNGRLCLSRTCSDCTSDGQCGAGKICVTGGCVTGVCHGDADCSTGLQCDTNPTSPTAWTCRSCSPLNTATSNSCGAGRVCDASGLCRSGNCTMNSHCGGSTPVCVNFNCTTCTQDSQCNSGQLCVNNQCRTGNCHGTGPDPHVDCAPTNNWCVNNVCTGNCRTNDDCTATGFCNTSGPAPTCGPCTAPGQCGIGKVCTPGGGGNTCVTAQCSSIEPNCPPGESCVSGACAQLGPNTILDGGAYTENGLFASSWPLPLSGANTIYFSANENSPTGNGTYSVALEPDLALRWRVRDSTGGNAKNSFGGAGIVLPAPGFPNDELFLANDGNNGAIAHRSDTGATVWRINLSPQAFATGLVNGVPHVAWTTSPFNPATLFWMRTDGTQQKQVTLTPCSPKAIAFGTRAIYVVCAESLYVVDPITATWKVVPHAGNPAVVIGNWAPAFVTPVWRPPDNYVARGVNSGTVTSDVLVYTGRPASGPPADWLLAVRVPDDWVTNASPTNTWTIWTNGTTSSNITPLAIDATGAIHITSQTELFKVSVFTGAQLSRTPIGSYLPQWNLASGSQVISVANVSSSSQLQGYFLADGATTIPPPVWALPASPGNWQQYFPMFQDTTTNGNNLLAWQNNLQGQPVLRALAPGPTAPSYVAAPPARALAGDNANHNSVPGYECTSTSQCPANQSCILGKCAGTCRQASQCPAGQGCSLGSCGNCVSQASCRSGEVCWVGQCYACTGPGCCNTSADCAVNNYCESGTCRPQPAHGSTGAFTVPNLVTRGLNNSGYTTVAPDGTLYVGDTNTSNQPFFRIVSPTGVVATPSPAVPVSLNLTFGPYPLAMVASNGSGNSVFYGLGTNLYSAPASSTIASWTTAAYTGFTASFMRLAQGTSNALGPNRPTLFATTTNASVPSNTLLLAIDAAAAAAGGVGNPGLLWTAVVQSSTCTLSTPVLDQLLIGSDGTVYLTCSDGSVMAWAADGDPTSGSPPSRMGLLKWKSAPPATWGGIFISPRPAIGNTGSGDVLYLAKSSGAPSLAILNLATAGNGTVPLEVTADGTAGILTDSSGRAITMGSSKEVAIVSPTGTVLFAEKNTWAPGGFSAVLTADGHLLMPESPSFPQTPRIVALTVNNPTQVAPLFTVQGAGGLTTDPTSSPVVVSNTQLDGGLLFFDYPPLSGQNRTVSGLPFPECSGPMPNAWSSRFGDLQRRSSLKTQ